MCHLDESWHVPCGHWGPRRNVSPCANGQVNEMIRIRGCLHSKVEGCSRVYTLCPSCEYRGKRDGVTPSSDASKQSQQSQQSQKNKLSQRRSQRPEQIRNSQPGMTVHGLSGKEGRNWLRHRLRRWRERKLTHGELSEKNRSQAEKENTISLNASKPITSGPSEVRRAELSEMTEQTQR